MEHSHLFLHGAKFNLIMDHKPLEVIMRSRASAGNERWILQLPLYTLKIVYKSLKYGAENPADYLCQQTRESDGANDKV